jgi:hypothetical protein
MSTMCARAVEPQVDRSPTWSRDGGLDGRLPERVASAEQPIDDPCLPRVANQGPCPFERRQPQVRSEDCRNVESRSEGDTRMALLELADQGAAHADRIGNRCLGDA